MTSFVVEDVEQKLFGDYAIRGVHLKQLKTLKYEEKCAEAAD